MFWNLNGLEAVWAAKKYRGHRCLPAEMEYEVEIERTKAAVTQ